jgi:hypothetical protein
VFDVTTIVPRVASQRLPSEALPGPPDVLDLINVSVKVFLTDAVTTAKKPILRHQVSRSDPSVGRTLDQHSC